MTTTQQAEMDVLRALFRSDFLGFVQRSQEMSPTSDSFGRATEAVFDAVMARRLPGAPGPERIAEFVTDALGRLGEGSEDLATTDAEALVGAALGGPRPGGLDGELMVQIRLLLMARAVADLGLSPEEWEELVARHGHCGP